MTTTIAHRQHVHVPLTPIIAVLATAVVAAAVPRPESPALRRQVAEGTVQVGTASEPFAYPLNHVEATTLDPASSHEPAPPAPTYLSGDVADPPASTPPVPCIPRPAI